MYRQTDDRKVWYEWIVEVFALERTAEPVSSGVLSPTMSGARGKSPAPETANKTDNNKQQQQQQQQQQPQVRLRSTSRRVKVGMSDLHSSIKEGCLM